MAFITMPAESIMTLTRSDLTSILRLSGTRKTGAITITPRKVFEYDADGCLRQERKTPCAVQGTMTLPLNFARLFVRLMDRPDAALTLTRINDRQITASYCNFAATLYSDETVNEADATRVKTDYARVSSDAYIYLATVNRHIRVTPDAVSDETFQARPLEANERGIRLLTHAPLVTYRYYDGLPVTDAPGRPTPAYKRVTP